jgi:hypothetical protein
MSSDINAGNGQNFGKLSEVGGRAVVAFLRQQYPVKTAACVEAEIGIPADTYRKWENGTAPSFNATLKLIARHGPEFLAAVMPTRFDWLDAAVQAREAKAIEVDIAEKRRRLDQLRANL